MLVCLLTVCLFIGECTTEITEKTIRYSVSELRELKSSPLVCRPDPTIIPPDIKVKKRGRKGGVKARNKRNCLKPALPSFILGNARSLNNKLDELHAQVQYNETFRTCSVMCFSETWFKPKTDDNIVEIDKFKVFRNDRQSEEFGKSKGGGGMCVCQQTMV